MNLTDQQAAEEMRRIEKDSDRFNLGMFILVMAILALAFAPQAFAQAAKVEVLVHEGTYRTGQFNICIEKAEAIAVAEAYAKGGTEAADKVLEAKGSCGGVSIDFIVGDVVFVANAPDGEFIKVVEVTNPRNASMKVYWVTTVTIVKAAPSTKKHKPDGVPRKGLNV